MEKSEIQHINITVSGKVQGVNFRYSARSVARTLGVKGFVKNMPNREVYIEAEGNKKQIDQFLRWCHTGPDHARVDNVYFSVSEVVQFHEFEIF